MPTSASFPSNCCRHSKSCGVAARAHSLAPRYRTRSNRSLAEAVDNATLENRGRVSTLYTNPACLMRYSACDLASARWFELARPYADVDAQLNGQAQRVRPGAYSAVRIEFCRGGPDTPNFRFAAGAMLAPMAWVRERFVDARERGYHGCSRDRAVHASIRGPHLAAHAARAGVRHVRRHDVPRPATVNCSRRPRAHIGRARPGEACSRRQRSVDVGRVHAGGATDVLPRSGRSAHPCRGGSASDRGRMTVCARCNAHVGRDISPRVSKACRSPSVPL